MGRCLQILFLAVVLFAKGSPIFAFDSFVRRQLIDSSHSGSAQDLKTFGDWAQFSGPMLGGLYLADGFWRQRDDQKDFGGFLIESFGIASLCSFGLKEAVGRARPNATDDPWSFSPGNSSSFPSGHATAAFAAATAIAEHYGTWEVAVPSYAAATAVGFSRVYANEHWASDVLAGAALGWSVSYFLNRSRYVHLWTLVPESRGLRVVWQWGPGASRN